MYGTHIYSNQLYGGSSCDVCPKFQQTSNIGPRHWTLAWKRIGLLRSVPVVPQKRKNMKNKTTLVLNDKNDVTVSYVLVKN